MPRQRRYFLFGRRFAHHFGRLIRIYWTSPDARWGLLLLAGAIALEIGTVYGNLLLSDAERRLMDAVGDKDLNRFLAAMGLFLAFIGGFVLVSTYRVYLRQLLEIRWRRGVTADYVDRWMSERAYLQLQLHRGELDNPDQRIAEDVRDFVASALGLSLSLLAAAATLASFGGLLWNLSGDWAVPLGRTHVHVPGIMLWVALLYAALSTGLTHIVGRRLVPLNFERLRFEADFRYGLMRFRDNVETVTLSSGEALERGSSMTRFQNVIQNWWQLVAAQRNLALLTVGIGQTNGLVPLLVAAPSFFAGLITLGTVAQIRFAYNQVSGALNWFVFAYQEIARWRANIERLSTFTEVMEATDADISRQAIKVVPSKTSVLRLVDLDLTDPGGRKLIEHANAVVESGDRVAITGPSGVGKTILLRAIAGIWPFGSGHIDLPDQSGVLFVPQWPYLPFSTLRAVVCYPAPERSFADGRIRELLGLLGLEHLANRLDETHLWDQQLSPHEQQRLAIVRVLLNEPQWVFLDKATSALDEETEKRIYDLLAERLPHLTLISVAQRPSLAAYHDRRWTIAPKDHGPSALEAA
jgi:putative ATP-binding cassette transporter